MTQAADEIDLGERVWYSTREAADYLRMHPVTLRNHATYGRIRKHQADSPSGRGGHLKFHKRDLDAFLESPAGRYRRPA